VAERDTWQDLGGWRGADGAGGDVARDVVVFLLDRRVEAREETNGAWAAREVLGTAR
jgi:hypothetical protein